jgi:hypothetical protein
MSIIRRCPGLRSGAFGGIFKQVPDQVRDSGVSHV